MDEQEVEEFDEQGLVDFARLLQEVANAAGEASQAVQEMGQTMHNYSTQMMYRLWLKAEPDFMARPERVRFGLN